MFQKKQTQFLNSFEHLDLGLLFVHSNAMKTLPLINVSPSKEAILNEHIELLHKIVPNEYLLVPTFSYQFPKTLLFDLDNTPSEVGHISEFYRNNFASWRSNDPMFSVSGAGHNLATENEIQCPFGNSSVFSKISDSNGYILFYGADFSSATIIHHIEYKAGVKYRYWKTFEGIRRQSGLSKKVTLKSHFRPMGKHLDYDWPRLISDLFEVSILNLHFSSVIGCNAQKLIEFWLSKLETDPFYLLDTKSRNWIEPMLNDLGRGFIQSDFEEI
ncbi:AAC(3) family N-acetyltransferase [Shewanella chilikensis]|uniref:AAC(3) family N-acetyltransferase n=1 Tax=Shewanella chilikensis TaxID=558541 RepID=UPI0030048650